jgi:hypothetical protein
MRRTGAILLIVRLGSRYTVAAALLGGAVAACAAETSERAPFAAAGGPDEVTAAGAGSDTAFGLDKEVAGTVIASSGVQVGDGGLAWCTSPSPEQLRTETALSPSVTLRVLGGGCIPSDGYYRACNDAGLPIHVPTCDAESATVTGKRLEIVASGRLLVAVSADSIDIVSGPMPGDTWSFGATERAVLASMPRKIGTTIHPDTRVVAVAFKGDDWHEPSEEFADVVPYPKTGTFTFWRKAACLEQLGCTMARWEASRSGLHVSAAEKDLYVEAKARIISEIPRLRGDAQSCPAPAILAAARVYMLDRLASGDEKAALREFDFLVAGMSTKRCTGSQFGHPKPLGAIRKDLVAGVRKFLAGGASARSR